MNQLRTALGSVAELGTDVLRPMLAAAALACAVGAAADVDHATFWSERGDANTEQIDHSAWQATLDTYLSADHPSGVNRFDYAALQANAADGQRLADYLASLQALDPRRYSAAEQMAYWINFYNALTVQLVANAYPVESIRDFGDNWLKDGPWDDVHANVAGRELTLNNMEHDILRPIWRDNRIHYAVNCASYGCPNLAPLAYAAANIEELLDAGARAYVNHPRGATLQDDGSLLVSSIFDWYQEDFGGSEKTVVQHLLKYAAPDLAASLENFEGSLDYDYDWTLNAP